MPFEGRNNLGSMHFGVSGVARGPIRTLELCRRAPERAYTAAQNKPDLMHASGQGLSKDYVWACAWFRLARDKTQVAAELRDRIDLQMMPAQIASARKRGCQAGARRRQIVGPHKLLGWLDTRSHCSRTAWSGKPR